MVLLCTPVIAEAIGISSGFTYFIVFSSFPSGIKLRTKGIIRRLAATLVRGRVRANETALQVPGVLSQGWLFVSLIRARRPCGYGRVWYPRFVLVRVAALNCADRGREQGSLRLGVFHGVHLLSFVGFACTAS